MWWILNEICWYVDIYYIWIWMMNKNNAISNTNTITNHNVNQKWIQMTIKKKHGEYNSGVELQVGHHWILSKYPNHITMQ